MATSSRQVRSSLSPRPTARPTTIRLGPLLTATFILFTVPLVIIQYASTLRMDEAGKKVKKLKLGASMKIGETASPKYTGKVWETEQTVSRRVLGETAFARCDVHSVNVGDHIAHDWLFLEARDVVNVIVVDTDGQFIVFKERKYAIYGETLAPVSGIIEEGESPFDAGRRAVLEELGVGSKSTQNEFLEADKKRQDRDGRTRKQSLSMSMIKPHLAPVDEFGMSLGNVPETEPDWSFLGVYRTMANRGGGFLYTYLLINALPLVEGGGSTSHMKAGDDELHEMLKLSKTEVAEVLTSTHQFKEIAWTAAMTLALLRLEQNNDALLGNENNQDTVHKDKETLE